MFKPQEIHDANTGVHIATGQHVNGTAWLRISLGPKTTTAFFNGAGDVTKLVPHNAPPPVGGPGEEKMTFAEVVAREDATKQEQVEHVDEISKTESARPADVDDRGEVKPVNEIPPYGKPQPRASNATPKGFVNQSRSFAGDTVMDAGNTDQLNVSRQSQRDHAIPGSPARTAGETDMDAFRKWEAEQEAQGRRVDRVTGAKGPIDPATPTP